MLPAVWAGFKGLDLTMKVVAIAAPIAILFIVYQFGHFRGKIEGKQETRAEWDAALVKQANETTKQIMRVHEMETTLAQMSAERDQVRQQAAEQINRKVEHHAKSKPAQPLSPEFVRLYDDLRRVPNASGDRVPPSDSGTGASEVPRREVRSPASQLIQIEGEDGETVELTTDELYQAVTGAYVKLGLVKDDYSDFSDWNEGRERIEKQRLRQD